MEPIKKKYHKQLKYNKTNIKRAPVESYIVLSFDAQVYKIKNW